MKIRLIPPYKVALLSATLCALMVAIAPNASAYKVPMPPGIQLTIGDTHELGKVLPGIPAGDADITYYVTTMIHLAQGGSTHVNINGHDNLITRSNNAFGSLPTPMLALRGTGTSINLGTQGTYTYLFAKYDGPNGGSEVWYVGDLSGVITIPATGFGRYGLSGWALFSGCGSVPDGGATVMLLGAALTALGMARRFLMKGV